MPLPTSKEKEPKKNIISSEKSNHITTKETTPITEHRFAHKSVLEIKEVEDQLITKGYIATTHFDGQDVILKETLDVWADEINEGIPTKNKLSIHHDRQSQVAGVGIKGKAEVHQFNDGHFGLYTESIINKSIDNYDNVKYELDNHMLDSYSIEFYPPENPNYNDMGARVLDTTTDLRGWTLASRPVNGHAVMVKELIDDSIVDKPQSTQKQTINLKEDIDVKMTEVKETPVETKPVEVKEQPILSKEDSKLLDAAKLEQKEKVMKDAMVKIMESKELQDKIKGIVPDQKPLANKEEPEAKDEGKPDETPEEKESKSRGLEFKSIVNSETMEIKEKFRQVGLLAEKEGLVWAEGSDSIGFKKSTERKDGLQFKEFQCNGSKMEYKSLGITTNQNTDTNYLLSAAELRDMFDPVIYDALNQSTTTWGLLRKEDYSMKGNNQVQFVLRTKANATAGFYTGNSVSTSQGGRLKLQTKFKKCQVGISVDGEMIAAARGGPIGDVFGLEVSYGTEDMLTVINSALFAEAGLETASDCIGFEYITDSAGNTTLYNMTRDGDKTSADYNGLSPDSAGDTYINGSSARISIANLRKAITQAKKEGADTNNLVFITNPTQVELFEGIYDASQRLMPTSSRFGFEGRPSFNGIPVFDDKDCNEDDWWLIDLATHKIAVWVPPTLEMLGKRSDADEGFVKMYFATYNVNPRRMVQIYGNSTS